VADKAGGSVDSGAADGEGPGPDGGPTGDFVEPGPPDGGLPDGVSASTVAELQAEAEVLGCDGSNIVTLKNGVAVGGVVVTVPKYDAFTPDDGTGALDSYFVADSGGGDWSGIMIVVDRAEGTDFKVGDLLDLTGELEEYYCMTQIGVSGYAVTGSGDAPTPLILDPATASAEMYEGMLLKVEDVEVEAMDQYGNATVTGGLEIGDEFDLYAGLAEGKRYDLTGVLMTSYGVYRLMPRSLADVVDLDDVVVPADVTDDTPDAPINPDGGDTVDPPPEDTGPTDTSTETLTISELQQSDDAMACDPSIVNGASGLVVEGIIAVGPFSVHENLNAYVIGDGSGEAWSGLTVVVEKAEDQGWSPGNIIEVTGDHIEFYCATQLNATSITKVGDSSGIVPVALASETTDMEPWESVVVTVSDVQVTSIENFEDYGEISVSLDGGATSAPFLLDDWIMGKDAMAAPSVGDVWSSVTGVVTYGYSSYRLAPLDAASMVSAQ
jgi:predicted extracellular nuclease